MPLPPRGPSPIAPRPPSASVPLCPEADLLHDLLALLPSAALHEAVRHCVARCQHPPGRPLRREDLLRLLQAHVLPPRGPAPSTAGPSAPPDAPPPGHAEAPICVDSDADSDADAPGPPPGPRPPPPPPRSSSAPAGGARQPSLWAFFGGGSGAGAVRGGAVRSSSGVPRSQGRGRGGGAGLLLTTRHHCPPPPRPPLWRMGPNFLPGLRPLKTFLWRLRRRSV